MKAVDTSVVVAAYATWHDGHVAARETLDLTPWLPAQAGMEAYSVLTRLPRPHRAHPEDVRAFLEAEFAERWLSLRSPEVAALIPQFVAAGIAGGATYDALIGMTAKHAGAALLTLDRRSLAIYDRLGVEVEVVG